MVQRLVDGQSSVSWTGAALAEDVRYRLWTMYGYMGMAAMLVLGVALAFMYAKPQKATDKSRTQVGDLRRM